MKVPMLDLVKEHAPYRAELQSAFDRVLESGRFVLGPEVEAFEKEIAAWIGVPHAIGVSNGSDALLLALQAVGVGPGDEVICPTYTFFATAGAVARLGATPVFVDIAECCYNLRTDQVIAKIGPKTKAIIPVHLFGQCADMDPILEVAAKRGIPVIEDAAQALGAKDKGRQAGTMGTLGTFSFFPTKNLGALGEGGLVTTKDPALAEKIRKLRVHGAKQKYFHEMIGGNFRLHELQAAFLRVKLKHLDSALQKRRANAKRLIKELQDKWGAIFPVDSCICRGQKASGPERKPGTILLPFSCQSGEEDHTWNQFVIRVTGKGKRDALREKLASEGVQTEIYYPRAMHEQDCFSSTKEQFPVAEILCQETLALPFCGFIPRSADQLRP
ncbi:MAG: DegT/DnrJ/EryC1/StrS family aminotransferase [Verrucomicrobia bacterium]|nr:DegT/DnrJ/EryC1/StrS family aminotransferase [Verrucomicrobiota bacterium]